MLDEKRRQEALRRFDEAMIETLGPRHWLITMRPTPAHPVPPGGKGRLARAWHAFLDFLTILFVGPPDFPTPVVEYAGVAAPDPGPSTAALEEPTARDHAVITMTAEVRARSLETERKRKIEDEKLESLERRCLELVIRLEADGAAGGAARHIAELKALLAQQREAAAEARAIAAEDRQHVKDLAVEEMKAEGAKEVERVRSRYAMKASAQAHVQAVDLSKVTSKAQSEGQVAVEKVKGRYVLIAALIAATSGGIGLFVGRSTAPAKPLTPCSETK